MAQVTLREILETNRGQGAVGAFNIHNLEFIQGVVRAAEEEKAPVILMINEAVLKYATIPVLGSAAIAAAKEASVAVAVMVDHGTDLELLRQAVDFGMDVMYDGSGHPFEKNVKNTREMVCYAHERGRSVEGEIGALGLTEDGEEEREQKITTVEEAVRFSKDTGVDVLAVSVGNAHGFYHGAPRIDLERIEQISMAVKPLPIVMHGGSGIPKEVVKKAILAGIRKFNIATELKAAYAMKMRELMTQDPLPLQPLQIFPSAAAAIAEKTAEKIREFRLEE